MDNIDKEELLKRYREGKVSEAELRQLESWYADWNMKDRIVLSEDNLNRAEELMRANVMGRIGGKRIKLWPRIAAVAAVVALIILGVYFFTAPGPIVDSNSEIVNQNDIAPGRVGATLTLANGKKISLTDASKGELANEAGISISKTADGQLVYQVKTSKNAPGKINTLSTAKGETYIVTLPDKSTVWMNASSSLTYSAALLERGARRVKLEGEAYFQVAKDKAHPFIVESGDQQVEVLGTHFNVRAYQTEKVFRTTLLEGSVKVSADGKTKMLSPGFEAIHRPGEITVGKADTEWAVAWKNNKFIFDSQRIEDIMPMIERWYNVDVIYTGEMPSDTFWGSVSRYNNISKVLGALESTGNVHFRIEGRKIYVTR